jgi:hypothetical protein
MGRLFFIVTSSPVVLVKKLSAVNYCLLPNAFCLFLFRTPHSEFLCACPERSRGVPSAFVPLLQSPIP